MGTIIHILSKILKNKVANMPKPTKNILFLHGWGGKRTHYWMPWFEAELTKLGFTVYAPQIPNSYNPKKDKWIHHIKEYVELYKPQAVVAHSIGALAWWHYLAQHPTVIRAQLFVAPPTHASFAKIEGFFPLPNGFNQYDAKVVVAKDDTNVDEKRMQTFCEDEKMQLLCLDRGGHFDPYSKVLELPEALHYLIKRFTVSCS